VCVFWWGHPLDYSAQNDVMHCTTTSQVCRWSLCIPVLWNSSTWCTLLHTKETLVCRRSGLLTFQRTQFSLFRSQKLALLSTRRAKTPHWEWYHIPLLLAIAPRMISLALSLSSHLLTFSATTAQLSSHEGHMGFTWGSHGGYMGSHGVTWEAHYIEPCLCSVDYIIACKGGNMTTCTDVTFLCYQQG